MPQNLELYITPEQAADDEKIRGIVKNILGQNIGHIQKIKQSIDARRTPVMIRLVVDVNHGDEILLCDSWNEEFSP